MSTITPIPIIDWSKLLIFDKAPVEKIKKEEDGSSFKSRFEEIDLFGVQIWRTYPNYLTASMTSHTTIVYFIGIVAIKGTHEFEFILFNKCHRRSGSFNKWLINILFGSPSKLSMVNVFWTQVGDIVFLIFENSFLKFMLEKVNLKYKINTNKFKHTKLIQPTETRGRVFIKQLRMI